MSKSQQLFAVSYGQKPGQIPLRVIVGYPEHEPDRVLGALRLLVAPEGDHIAIISTCEPDEASDSIYQLDLFDRGGKFIRSVKYNFAHGYGEGHRLKATRGFYIKDASYGVNGLLYVLCERSNVDGTGRTRRIDIYDAQGTLLQALSDAYTRALQSYAALTQDGSLLGVDKNGLIYFDLYKEIISIDREGRRGWLSKPFIGESVLAVDEPTLYTVKHLRKNADSDLAVRELWSETGGRFQKRCTIPADTKVYQQLKAQYSALKLCFVTGKQSFWLAFPNPEKHRKLNTSFGVIRLYQLWLG